MPQATEISHNPVSWLTQWPTTAPKYNLPDGRQIYARVKHLGVNIPDAVGRAGINALQNPEAPLAARGRWYESKQLKGGTNGDAYPGEALPVQEWEDFATREPLYAFEEDEFLEGEWHVRAESAQYLAFKRKRAEMYRNAGKVNNSYYCYGGFFIPIIKEWKVDGVAKNPTDQAFRQYYANANAARQFAPSYFALLWNSDVNQVTCWPNLKFYPETPYTANAFYIYKSMAEWLMLGMNGVGRLAYVSWENIESLPDQTTPAGAIHGECRTARHVNSPSGKVVTNIHPNWDLDQQRAQYFIIGMVIGNQCVAWDHMGIRGTDPNTIWNAFGGDVEYSIWQPDNAGVAPPFGSPGYTPNRLNWYDYALAGASLLYYECARTEGATWNYLRIRVNNGAWIDTQSDKSDNLFNAQNGRGDCMGRVKGNAADFYYYNPSRGKHEAETITVQLGGKEFTYTVWGKKLYVFNETV